MGLLVELMVPAEAHGHPSLSSSKSKVAMDDLGENTTVLSTLRSLNNFISQRVEAGSGLDAVTSAPGSLQTQYQQSMQVRALGCGVGYVCVSGWKVYALGCGGWSLGGRWVL